MKLPTFPLTAFVGALLLASPGVAQTADMVFTNASVLTMNDAQPTAEAVAVIGNKISFVGSAADAQALIGDTTQVFDLDGDTLLPGFVSGHDHLVASGWTSRGVDLFGIKSVDEAVAMIKDYADSHPDEDIVFGFGFNQVEMGGWPTKADLDSAVSDRPAFILDFTIHDAWLNSKAFEVGSVAEDDADQVPDTIYWQRDEAGKLTGIGIEFQWLPALNAAGGWNPAEDIPAIQENFYNIAASVGMTAVHVAGLATPMVTNPEGAINDLEMSMNLLHEFEMSGGLKMRSFVASMFKTPKADPKTVAKQTAAFREKWNSDMLRIWGIKIHPEGNWSSKTSLMLEPYSDGSESYGGAAVNADLILAVHLEANKLGLDVGTHVDGSATVRGTIDAIQASRDAGNSGERNVLHHYFWATDDDHARVIEMGLPVNSTPQFSTDWEGQDRNALDLLGEDRTNTEFARYSELMDIGHNVSLSADIPSSPISMIAPLFSAEIAMTLQDPTNPDSKPFPPSRPGASLDEALKAITINAAYQVRMEDKIGTLEVGKYADLVVLETDITQVAPRDISDIKVVGTVMNGKFTHRDGL